MGYQAPIEFQDESKALWVGAHWPEFVDLEGIFRQLITMDARAIDGGLAGEEWRRVLRWDVHIVRMLSPGAVHVHVPRAAVVKDMIIQLMHPTKVRGLRKLTERIERSRSHRAHWWGQRLRALGLATPRPLGYVERATTPARFASFAVTEYDEAVTLLKVRDTGIVRCCGRLNLLLVH